MKREGLHYDKKSLRHVVGKSTDWAELARDCVSFATALGGELDIGIEDKESLPPAGQVIPDDLPQKLRTRIAQQTINVTVTCEVKSAKNGGEFLRVTVPRAEAVPSTTDGRYFIRDADGKKPVLGDDVLRLADERNSLSWERMIVRGLTRKDVDRVKQNAFVAAIQASDRVKSSVKEKNPAELLAHYNLSYRTNLTNLGVLCLGRQEDRARLPSSPVVQAIKYDVRDRKVWKQTWNDHALSPVELIDDIWATVPDFRESHEIPNGLFRERVPAYDERVIRELLINALAHRPYTQSGDVFLNLYPNRLSLTNPGQLPIGVTPGNILHTTKRRNEGLTRIFHDLKMMEGEGSGFDLMYEVLLSQARPVPFVEEGPDRVVVTVQRTIIDQRVVDLLAKVDQHCQLTQRERICFGLLAQSEGLKATELIVALALEDTKDLKPWLGRLPDYGLVQTSGKTRGMRYFVPPDTLQEFKFPTTTSLARIESHRLRELVLEDVKRYPGTAIGDIHDRVGKEIPRHHIKHELDALTAPEVAKVRAEGDKRWRRYWPV